MQCKECGKEVTAPRRMTETVEYFGTRCRMTTFECPFCGGFLTEEEEPGRKSQKRPDDGK